MWIQNVPKASIGGGVHRTNDNTMLIQIVSLGEEFPVPVHPFTEVHQFRFLDVEETDETTVAGAKFTDEQAKTIVELLKRAFDYKMNVLVHCEAGVCRSGAVTEVGVMMGFEDTGVHRTPNLLVKHKLMKALGWTYDSTEQPYCVDHGEVTPLPCDGCWMVE